MSRVTIATWQFFLRNSELSNIQSEVRATLLSRLDQNTTSLFTGPTKISTLGALGESLVSSAKYHFPVDLILK